MSDPMKCPDKCGGPNVCGACGLETVFEQIEADSIKETLEAFVDAYEGDSRSGLQDAYEYACEMLKRDPKSWGTVRW